MVDACENLPSSPNEKPTIGQSLLCSQQNIYNDLYERYKKATTTNEKDILTKQMGEVADTIMKLSGAQMTENTSVEVMEKPIPFEIIWWSMKAKILTTDGVRSVKIPFTWERMNVPNTKLVDRTVQYSGSEIKRISPNQYQAIVHFKENRTVTVDIQYNGNILIASYFGNRSEPQTVDDRQKRFINRTRDGGKEIFNGTTPITFRVWKITLTIGNFISE